MNAPVRRKLEMVARVRTFSRTHPSDEPTYATVLARLEEGLARAEAIATRQHEGRLAARGARARRKELRRAVHTQLLRYLVTVGTIAAKDRAELAARFRLPSSGGSHQVFLTAVKALLTLAKEQKDALVEAGMAPALLEELERMVSQFETASEEARAGRQDHIQARLALEEIVRDLMEQVRVLDGINRWRFGRDPELLGAWQAARDLLPASPRSDRPPATDKEVTPPGPGGVTPAA